MWKVWKEPDNPNNLTNWKVRESEHESGCVAPLFNIACLTSEVRVQECLLAKEPPRAASGEAAGGSHFYSSPFFLYIYSLHENNKRASVEWVTYARQISVLTVKLLTKLSEFLGSLSWLSLFSHSVYAIYKYMYMYI